MKHSTSRARVLGNNLALILFSMLLVAPVGAVSPVPGEPDPISPQLIGPTLQWHTFMGGSGTEYGYSVAVDISGNVYVAGRANASWGSPVRAYEGGIDAFAAKLNSSGVLQWHTFLGESGTDIGTGVAVDGSGNVYVCGLSTTSWESPVRAYTSSFDAFAANGDRTHRTSNGLHQC